MKLILATVVLVLLVTCRREERRLEAPVAQRDRANPPARLISLQPGPDLPTNPADNPYGGNAYGISEGKRLYEWFNCAGCHFQGGGGIGPALMDDEWIYGSEPENVFRTIVEGRPNGMPSFGGHIPEYQIWQIVAYVRSLAKLEPMDARPARADELDALTGEDDRMEKAKKPPEQLLQPGGIPQPAGPEHPGMVEQPEHVRTGEQLDHLRDTTAARGSQRS